MLLFAIANAICGVFICLLAFGGTGGKPLPLLLDSKYLFGSEIT